MPLSVQKPPRYRSSAQSSRRRAKASLVAAPPPTSAPELEGEDGLKPNPKLLKDIIARILRNVNDDQALARCMRVSRAFREIAAPLLYARFEITYDCGAGQHYEHEALLQSLGSRSRTSSLAPIEHIGTISLNPVALCECITYMVHDRFFNRDRLSLPRLKAFIMTDAGQTGKDDADMRGYISANVPFLTDKVVFQDSFDLGFMPFQRDVVYRADLSPLPDHIVSSIRELVFLHTAWMYDKPNLFYQTRDVRDKLDNLTSIRLVLRPSRFFPTFKPSEYPKYVSDTIKQLVEVLKTTDKVFKRSLAVHKIVLVGIAEAFEPNCASPYSRFATEDEKKLPVEHHDYEKTKAKLFEVVKEINETREQAKARGKEAIKVELEIKTFEEYLAADDWKTEVPEYLVSAMRSYARRWKRTVEKAKARKGRVAEAGPGRK